MNLLRNPADGVDPSNDDEETTTMSDITTETHGELASLACLNWRTLSDERAADVRPNGETRRAAIIMTGACNFACPYCKTLGGDKAPTRDRQATLDLVQNLIHLGLKDLRLSGGEPTLVPWLGELVWVAAEQGVHVAISTNGYARERVYRELVEAGAKEFSISLDTLDPDEADLLAGGRKDVLKRVLRTIELLGELGAKVYVGMTCCNNQQSTAEMKAAVTKAAELGVTDVKIMSPAQEGTILDTTWLTDDLKARFPFLAWRAANFRCGRDVRGLRDDDSHKCPLVLDDVTVAGAKHYPCNVYFREGGDAIGLVGHTMMADRAAWYEAHDTHKDPICSGMCMDLLRVYNNRVRATNKTLGG